MGVVPLTESKLPWDMSCRQDMMRSFGGCVEVLSLRVRPVWEDRMLLGRPNLDRFENTEAVSQLSMARVRFENAQSWRKTLIAPV